MLLDGVGGHIVCLIGVLWHAEVGDEEGVSEARGSSYGDGGCGGHCDLGDLWGDDEGLLLLLLEEEGVLEAAV